MLWMFRLVMFGPLDKPENQKLQDLNGRELLILAPILILIVCMGIYPKPFLSRMQPAVEQTLKRMIPAPAAAAETSPASGEPKRDGR
jgi:NADH-quinone oxidoreductase subunit M